MAIRWKYPRNVPPIWIFFVPNPPRIHKEIDVSLILNKLGLDRKVLPLDGYEKYVHPDLEVEFLTSERGREGPDLSYGKAN